jgi:hypothetical protein
MLKFTKKQLDGFAKKELTRIKKTYYQGSDRLNSIKIVDWSICICNSFPITIQMEMLYENMGIRKTVFDIDSANER